MAFEQTRFMPVTIRYKKSSARVHVALAPPLFFSRMRGFFSGAGMGLNKNRRGAVSLSPSSLYREDSATMCCRHASPFAEIKFGANQSLDSSVQVMYCS